MRCEARCLPTADARKACHRRLADYFHQRPEVSDRELDELPWQWQRAEAWTELKDLLTQMKVFRRMGSEERWKRDLQSYWLALQPHHDPCDAYREAVDRWETEADCPETFATALHQLGLFHNERVEHTAGEPLLRRALAIDEKSYGAEHPVVAGDLNSLAQSLQNTNCREEAKRLLQRALAIDEKHYGHDHPVVANILHNLAMLTDTNHRQAELLYRRALTIRESSLGLKHVEISATLNNLAQLLRATNRLAEAEPLYRRGLAIEEKSRGTDHPKVAVLLNNLAGLLMATNRLVEAESLYRRALAIDEKAYGAEHPYVAIRLNNLAQLLYSTNRLSEAEPLMRRALAIDQQFLGSDHPVVATRLNNLAQLLQETSRLAEAEPLMRRMVEILLKSTQKTHSPHPHLQAAFGNYAHLLQAMGKSDADIQQCRSGLLAEYGVSTLI